MDGTGSTTSKAKVEAGTGKEKSLPKEHWKYLHSIHEFQLAEKVNKKRLQYLFDAYLRPVQNESKSLDITKEWGRTFKEASSAIPKKLM